MRRAILPLTVIAVAGVCATLLHRASLGQESVEARSVALLLRNGEVLEGRVSMEGDYCALLLEHGELRIRREQVAAIEPSLDAIYRTHIFPKAADGVEGHTERADWCLRHNLLGYAAGEITAAARLAPDAQRVVALRQRLETARRTVTPKTELADSPAEESQPTEPEAAEEVDSKAIETFTVAVQPLLLNRCANAMCHGHATASEFRLQRGIDGRPMPRSLTLENLAATLRYVDRAQPTASRLLTTPIRPHAKAKEAVFLQQHHKQYDQLVRWVEQLATETGAAPIAADASQQSHKQQPKEINAAVETLSRPLAEPRRPLPNANAAHAQTESDPHDPAEFNRRFSKKRTAKSGDR